MRRASNAVVWIVVGFVVAFVPACSDDEEQPGGGGSTTTSGGGTGGSGGVGGAGGLGGSGGSGVCEDHCQNGSMDCGESYLDCGGACDPCQPVEIAPLAINGSYPRISLTSTGRRMVVIHRDAGQDARLRWTCFDGTAWSAVAQVTDGNGFEGYPWIVADSQDRYHLVYSNGLGDGRTVHYNRYDDTTCSGSWQTDSEVLPREHAYSVTYPSVGVDENDRPTVTYSQSIAEKPDPYVACPGGQTDCSQYYHCYGSSSPTCIPDYVQYATQRADGAWGSDSWATPAIIGGSPIGTLAHHGSVFVHDSTHVHAVWMQDSFVANPSHRIFYAQYDGSSWSTPEDTGIGAHAADVQADGQDVFVFANTARFSSRPVAGGSWTDTVNVSSGPTTINLIKLRIGSDGRLHGVFNQAFRIMYAVTDGAGTWLPAKPVSPEVVTDTLYGNEPSLDVDADGVAHIVWSQSDCPFNAGNNGAECEFGSVWYLATRYEELP